MSSKASDRGRALLLWARLHEITVILDSNVIDAEKLRRIREAVKS